jgi:HlyD family secretion protein
MTRRESIAIAALVVATVAGFYLLWRAETATPIVGVVRTTEVRIAPEVGGQLAAIKVTPGTRVRVGDVVAELSAVELTASVGQARAQLAAAKASRDHVYAGVRAEQVASLAAEIAKAKARLDFTQAQLTRTSTLASNDFAAQQALDQAVNDVANARADVAEAEANHQAAVAGPTREERAIADAEVDAAASALAVLERRLNKTILRAPGDGVVTVIVAEIGENVRAGQPVLVIAETGKQFLSFNAREDLLHGLMVGTSVNVRRSGAAEKTPALVTELRPLGTFATWQPSALLAIMTAIHCACASICRVIQPDSSQACRSGSILDLDATKEGNLRLSPMSKSKAWLFCNRGRPLHGISNRRQSVLSKSLRPSVWSPLDLHMHNRNHHNASR